MRYSLRTLFALTAIIGLALSLIVLPILDYQRELRKLQELAALKGGGVRVHNGRAVGIEFVGTAVTDEDLARINWKRFSLKIVLLYQCNNLSDKAIDAMQLDDMPALLSVDAVGSAITWPRLVKLYDRRQCNLCNGDGLLTHPRVTLNALNSF